MTPWHIRERVKDKALRLVTEGKDILVEALYELIDSIETSEDVEVEDEDEGLGTDPTQTGSITLEIPGRWVDGTSVRDIFAGSIAHTALWVGSSNETEEMGKIPMERGPYLVRVTVEVEYEPIPKDEDVDPRDVYNGTELVARLTEDRIVYN